MTESRVFSIKRTAESLDLSVSTVRRQIKSGAMKSALVSARRRVVPASEIDRILGGKDS